MVHQPLKPLLYPTPETYPGLISALGSNSRKQLLPSPGVRKSSTTAKGAGTGGTAAPQQIIGKHWGLCPDPILHHLCLLSKKIDFFHKFLPPPNRKIVPAPYNQGPCSKINVCDSKIKYAPYLRIELCFWLDGGQALNVCSFG